MKKQGFSYLELIISMGLVVMVVFLTTPFLIHLEKSALTKYGEYRAYAKFVCKKEGDPDCNDYDDCVVNADTNKCDWILFENVRRSTPEYSTEDKRCACDGGEFNSDGTCKRLQICQFLIPNRTTNYKVHVFGAGGGGSQGYYEILNRGPSPDSTEDEQEPFSAEFYRGEGGKAGVSLHPESESLAKAVSNIDNTVVQIFKCSDLHIAISPRSSLMNRARFDYPKHDKVHLSNGENAIIKNCIGIGGSTTASIGNNDSNGFYSDYQRFLIRRMFTEEKTRNTKDTYCRLAQYYFQNTGSSPENPSLPKSLCDYVDKYKSGHKDEANSIFNNIVTKEEKWSSTVNGTWVDLLSYGDWGGDTFFWFDDSNEPVPVRGGEGGKTIKSKAISFEPDKSMSLSEFINPNNPNNKDNGYYTDNYFILTGNEGQPSGYTAGSKAIRGDCLDLENNFDEKFCRGNIAPVNKCSIKGKEVNICDSRSDNDQNKYYSFGAGGAGGAIKLEKTRYNQYAEGDQSMLNPGGMGAGGAIVIQWE